jgi:hypothetical protein
MALRIPPFHILECDLFGPEAIVALLAALNVLSRDKDMANSKVSACPSRVDLLTHQFLCADMSLTRSFVFYY